MNKPCWMSTSGHPTAFQDLASAKIVGLTSNVMHIEHGSMTWSGKTMQNSNFEPHKSHTISYNLIVDIC